MSSPHPAPPPAIGCDRQCRVAMKNEYRINIIKSLKIPKTGRHLMARGPG